MAQGAVKNFALAPAPFPNNRHYHAINPVQVAVIERGGGENFVGGVNVHIVLLAVHGKVFQSGGDGIVGAGDLYGVVNEIARMGHPLPADHKLIFGVIAKRVSHAPMPSGEPHPRANRVEQAFFLLRRDGAHGPDLGDEGIRLHFFGVEVSVEGVGDFDFVPLFAEEGGKNVNAFLGFVAFPAAPNHKSFFHIAESFLQNDTPNKIELVSEVDQFAVFDLRPAGREPGGQLVLGHFRAPGERLFKKVEDVVQKVSLVAGIAVRAGKYDPIGTARREDFCARVVEVGEEMTPGAAVPRGAVVREAFVHRAVVEGEDERVERVFGLEDGFAVEVEGKVEEAAGADVGEEMGQGTGKVKQVEDGVGDEEVEGGWGNGGREGEEIGEEKGGGGGTGNGDWRWGVGCWGKVLLGGGDVFGGGVNAGVGKGEGFCPLTFDEPREHGANATADFEDPQGGAWRGGGNGAGHGLPNVLVEGAVVYGFFSGEVAGERIVNRQV